MFHTQEARPKKIAAPIECLKDNAWLGNGFYFWYSLEDAMYWGRVSKKRTGEYEIYSGSIDFEDVLDTVFNEDDYLLWIDIIEKAAVKFVKKTNRKPNLKELNDYLKDRGAFEGIDGIMFQDISKNPEHYLVEEFQYKKRIQLVAYNLRIISNFEPDSIYPC